MWFKNLQIFRLPRRWAITAEDLCAALASRQFGESTAANMENAGFVPPREGGPLVHAVNGQFLIALQQEKRLLPAAFVKQVLKERVAEFEEQQGFPPGRKAKKDLKSRIEDEMLPRAFPIRKIVHAWIDPVNGWLVVDTSSPARAEDMLKLLLKAIDRFPVQTVRLNRSPIGVMSAWLETDEAPSGFTIDQDAELRATGESKAAVRFVKHTLDSDDVRRHIKAGKQATKLAMTWNDRVSFVLTESFAIKRVAPLDVIKEGVGVTYDDAERFDSDFVLMTGELSRMIADTIEALGGEDDAQSDLVSKDAQQ